MEEEKNKRFLLRNVYNEKEVFSLSQRIKENYKEFNDKEFSDEINSKLKELNFGERSIRIQKVLKKHLPDDFSKAAQILVNSLGPERSELEFAGFEGIITVPLTEYIAKEGIDYFEISMNTLYEMTKRFSSEWAIRYFIQKYPEKTIMLLKRWVKDENPHVRRLVSEGTRPRLPLGVRLKMFQKNPVQIIELLEELKTDPVLNVRRSVANNLNDISKDNPQIVIDTLRRWNNTSNIETKWIIRHALRTLLKKGNKDTLHLLGYNDIKIKNLEIKIKSNKINDKQNLEFDIMFESIKDQKLMIDYVIYFLKSNGKHREKIFKIANKNAKRGEIIKLSRKHSFREMTTRKHYSGNHFLKIIINGESFDKKKFVLVDI